MESKMSICPFCGTRMQMKLEQTTVVKSKCKQCGLKMEKDFMKNKIIELYAEMKEMRDEECRSKKAEQ